MIERAGSKVGALPATTGSTGEAGVGAAGLTAGGASDTVDGATVPVWPEEALRSALAERWAEIQSIQATLAALREDIIRLQVVIARRMWTPEEAQQAEELLRRSDQLHGELQRLRLAFDRMRCGGTPSSEEATWEEVPSPVDGLA
jgi:hypothetical protein